MNTNHNFKNKKKNKSNFLTKYISLSVPILLLTSHAACAREHFNPALLETSEEKSESADLSDFENGMQAPGRYRVDIMINRQSVDTQEIDFTRSNNAKGEEILKACLSLEQLRAWGVDVDRYPDLAKKESACIDIAAIPDANEEFIFNEQRLNLSVPQVSMIARARDYIPPEKWDEGITAFLLNYSLNGSSSTSRTGERETRSSQYGNFRPGFNIGPWRFRNYSTWNHDDGGQNKWDSINNYVSRDIKSLRSQLTLGDSNSPGDIFDSISFRGLQMASDTDMTPDSLKGYAPVIHGIARSNAEVTVYQNGHSIYKTTVAPGAFQINDLYPTGGAGDMNVVIKESDGSEQKMVIPYASLPVMRREGNFDYIFTGGTTNTNSGKDTKFAQFTAIYGLPHGFTIYGGVQHANIDYSSVSLGVGLNLGGIGAISTDISESRATVEKTPENNAPRYAEQESGHSLRLRYSKNFLNTGTNFTVAGYRYSTQGYYTLTDTLDSYAYEGKADRRRYRTELSISQDIIYGALSASYIRENYWNQKSNSSLSLSYSNAFKGINYGFNYVYNLNANPDDNSGATHKDNDQQYSFNISIPLDKFLSGSSVNYSVNSSKDGETTHNVNLSGTALNDNSLNWSVQEGYSSIERKTNGSVYSDYKGRYAEINGGYAYDANINRFSYGVQGGLVAHHDGITLSQPFNDTIILVNTNGAEDVPLTGQVGIKTNDKGYAVVPYANPYHKNWVSLDTENLQNSDVELIETSKSVIPTRGAVVEAGYNTSVGDRVLMTLLQQNGKPVPFGAKVRIAAKAGDAANLLI